MEDRTYENVGNKNVLPYQAENPEISQDIKDMAANFMEDLACSIPGERYKAGDTWTGQKRSTTKELSNFKDLTGASWDKISKVLNDIYDGNGNYALAKKMELELDQALSEGYTNIHGKVIMPNNEYLKKKSKIEGKEYSTYSDSYNSISNNYDNTFSLKKNNDKRAEKGNIKYNNQEKLSNSIENLKNAKGKIDRDDIINISSSLNVYHKGTTYIDKNMKNKAGKNKMPQIVDIDEFFTQYIDKEDLRKQAYKYAFDNYKNKTVLIKDIDDNVDISQSGLKKTFGKNQDNTKMQTANNLPKLIEESIYLNSSISTKNSNIVYHYFYVPISINNENQLAMITVKEDLTNKGSNSKFYYHDIREIKNIKKDFVHAMPHKDVSNMLFEQNPSITNSITQNNKSVKNTAITNNSMQKIKNDTSSIIEKSKSQRINNGGLTKSNDDIRHMKKSRASAQLKLQETDNKGRKLSEQQQDYFKNSKVRDNNGNLKVVYHGTDADFTVFNYDYLGKNGTANGKGFYLADDINVAKSYSNGKNLIEAYVDIQKPLSIGRTTMSKNDYIKFVKAVNDKTNGTLFADYGDGEKLTKNSKEYNDVVNQFKEEYKYGGDDVDLALSILNSANIKLEDGYRVLRNTTGYDGIIVPTNYKDNGKDIPYTQYIPLTPEQIKNVDNTSPTNNVDIRYLKNSTSQDSVSKINVNNIPKAVDTELGKTNAEREDSYIEKEIQKVESKGNWDNSIPVTKLSDINKTIEDYLQLKIKKGRFRQDAYGIYKDKRDVLRVQEYKDIDTALHEAGHAMDLGKRINVDKESISEELLNAIDKYGGYEGEPRSIKLDEGFAEVIREYGIKPEEAKKDYPNTIAILENMRMQDKSFDDFISKVQEMTYNYIHQSPRNRTLSNLSVGEQTDKKFGTKRQ